MSSNTNTQIINKIKEILISKNEKVSVAESLTSGMLQANFAKVSGISECFEGGITAYSLNAKVSLLGVERDHAKNVNCVSNMVAKQMANGVAKALSTELSIATTGYAEPYEPEGVTVAFAHICVSYNGIEEFKKVTLPKQPNQYANPRDAMRKFVTEEALKMALNIISLEINPNTVIHN